MFKQIFSLLLLTTVASSAYGITWKYDTFNSGSKTCQLKGWGGTQPTSGKLTIPSQYTHSDGMTYTVNCIASNDLNDLTEVTQVTIPASIKRIGNVGGQSSDSGIENFMNCPKLTKFIVEDGNTKFGATGKGILVNNKGTTLYRVPAAAVFDNGEYSIHSKVDAIKAGCFTDNQNITTITFPAATGGISDYAGFSTMAKLEKFVVNANNKHLTVRDGALIDTWLNNLIAYPPMRTIQNLEITYPIKDILTEAFANTKHLKTVKLPSSLRYIFPRAFMNSSITGITLPEGLKYIYEEAFYRSKLTEITFPSTYNYDTAFPRILASCKNLTKITAKGKDIGFSDGFASNCSKLTTVKTETPPTFIRENAFKNCPSLTSFPFSVKTQFSGDSIFANTGFTKVSFPNETSDEYDGLSGSDYMFVKCKNLTTIDFSALELPEDEWLSIPTNFVNNCPNFTLIRLPKQTSFVATPSEGYSVNFGPAVPIKKIVVGQFYSLDYAKIACYKGPGTFKPKTYVKNTVCDSNGLPIRPYSQLQYFYESIGDNTIVKPEFYCESYLAPRDEYVDANATYYIPGACSNNYSLALQESQGVVELFDISCGENAGKIRMSLKPAFDYVKISYVMFNDAVRANPEPDGTVNTYMEYAKVNTVRVHYTVYGEEMQTVYPIASLPQSSVNDINDTSNSLILKIIGRKLTVTGAVCTPRYEVFDINGASVASGSGSMVDLSFLHPGIYIIKVTDSNESISSKIRI